MFAGTRKRLQIVCNKRSSRSVRVFALLEVFCFYASVVSLLALAAQCVAQALGYSPGAITRALTRVSLSAAVGYLTNSLAIEMLFKPYEPVKWLKVWPQGLVPRNKSKIGRQLGSKVASELLKPEEIANKLCAMAQDYLHDEHSKRELVEYVVKLLNNYKNDIVATVTPAVETICRKLLDMYVTRENFERLWEEAIRPKLQQSATREFMTQRIIAGLNQHVPQLTVALRRQLAVTIRDYVNHSLLGLGGDTIALGVVEFIDWHGVENLIRNKLNEPQTVTIIKDILATQVNDLQNWLHTAEGQAKVEEVLKTLERYLADAIDRFINFDLARVFDSILNSPKAWRWAQEALIPKLKGLTEQFLQEKTGVFLEKINIDEMIAESVERQNTREFHQMVNDLTAEHLGAIETLGYVLGGLIGMLQLLLG
ncbi:MAG: DUF445 family protein [Planctomycetia bacterium]|nr:DUF445 family protein [Planctomycetia bacterium]